MDSTTEAAGRKAKRPNYVLKRSGAPAALRASDSALWRALSRGLVPATLCYLRRARRLTLFVSQRRKDRRP